MSKPTTQWAVELIPPKPVWAGIVLMLGYIPARRWGVVAWQRYSVATYGQERWVHTEVQS